MGPAAGILSASLILRKPSAFIRRTAKTVGLQQFPVLLQTLGLGAKGVELLAVFVGIFGLTLRSSP